ncbi:MAG: response regulator [Gemmatimonadota bacterium]|nr:MAG: response regulator [Gemmatimonadota bacterium]
MNRAVLEHQGYEVVTAFSGKEGLETVKLERPDAIVLDLMMEKHDSGFTFAKNLKADPNLKHIPILMLTSVADATGYQFSLEEDGYWMKTDDFAEKPLLPTELVARIEKLLEKTEEEGASE